MNKTIDTDPDTCVLLHRPRTRLVFEKIVRHGPVSRADVANMVYACPASLQYVIMALADGGFIDQTLIGQHGRQMLKAIRPIEELQTFGNTNISRLDQDTRVASKKITSRMTSPAVLRRGKNRVQRVNPGTSTKSEDLDIAHKDDAREILARDVEEFQLGGNDIEVLPTTWQDTPLAYPAGRGG